MCTKALLSYAKHASETFHVVAITPCSCLRPYLVQHHVMGIMSMTRWSHCALYNALVTHPRHPCFCDNAMSCPRSALVMASNMALDLWPSICLVAQGLEPSCWCWRGKGLHHDPCHYAQA